MTKMRPGASFSRRAFVASGVTSLGVNPVPPGKMVSRILRVENREKVGRDESKLRVDGKRG